jgi:3'(2'), 5'-bisphosphate nucleotidase
LSEEEADNKERLDSKRVWIIDPMDGTKDFIHKTGDFSVMIGLVEKMGDIYRPILGVVYVPVTQTHYYASLGGRAFRKEKDKAEECIKVSQIDDFKESKMISSRFHKSELEDSLFNDLLLKERIPCGSVGVKINKIAEGGAEFNMNPSDRTWEWDVCAPDIIISEAGGVLRDIKGTEFNYNKENPRNSFGYFASNGKNHNKFLKQMESYEEN